MDAVLAALEGSAIAQTLRVSRWGYAAVNATHILGIALLVGATVPLSLRFLGAWRGVSRAGLAVTAGILLFSVRAREYAGIGFLQAKLVLVAVGAVSALALHRAHGLHLEGASERRLAGHAILTSVCWIGALVCGRLIAFADD